MQSRHTTIMILVPGRPALSLDLSALLAFKAALVFLILPLGFGAGMQRCWELTRTSLPPLAMGNLERVASGGAQARARLERSGPAPSARGAVLAAVRTTRVGGARASIAPEPSPELRTAQPERPPPQAQSFRTAGIVPFDAAGSLAALPGRSALTALEGPAVLSVKAIIRALSASRKRGRRGGDPAKAPINGVLRIQALHLGETLSARPFDDLMRPDRRAFEDINHLMRCRVTGHEVEMDPQLIAILAQLSTHYGRMLQLISGHRAPYARGTSPTSQHTLGRAADVRIPGVTADELKKVAIKLGARGVGVYPEKGFVHIDVRQKARYFWSYTARGGELADSGMRRAPAHTHAESNAEEDEEPALAEGELVGEAPAEEPPSVLAAPAAPAVAAAAPAVAAGEAQAELAPAPAE